MLAGEGKHAAYDEIMAHIETIKECGDVRLIDEGEVIVQHTGSSNYLDAVEAYLH